MWVRRAVVVAGLVLVVVGAGGTAHAADPTPTPTSTCLRPPPSGSVIGQTSTSLTFAVAANGGCGYRPVSVDVYLSLSDAQMSQHQQGGATALTVQEAAALVVGGLRPGTLYWWRFSGGGSSFMSLAAGPHYTSAAESGCVATYQLDGEWQGGLVARVTVRNTSTTTVTGWRVSWNWPGGQHVSSAWGASVTSSGAAVSATAADYNRVLEPGASTTFGFLADGSGPAPTSLTLACARV